MEMKNLQIVIDLKDLYTQYGEYDYETGCSEPNNDGDFDSVLKSEIQRQVINTIIKSFTPEVTKKLKDETIEKFNDQFTEKVGARISRVIEHGVFSDKKGTFNVHEYVKQRFEIATQNSTFQATLDKVIKTRIAEMQKHLQDRYDLEFASMIIKNLKDGNMLKEGAEKMLIND